MITAQKFFVTIILVTNVLRFELAMTPEEKARGMMNRSSWGQIDGMVFLNEEPRSVAFWMKNTYLPMAIWYLGPDCALEESYFPKILTTDVIPSSNTNIQFVLEVRPELTNLLLNNYNVFSRKLKDSLAPYIRKMRENR